mmetsp:Transcript_10413/g.21874  ORF Transcript_10413/g.21874 Transcript_10413/m.21874 type:complete len:83 (+) Transcript_10413:919-1167(+)
MHLLQCFLKFSYLSGYCTPSEKILHGFDASQCVVFAIPTESMCIITQESCGQLVSNFLCCWFPLFQSVSKMFSKLGLCHPTY